MLPQVQQGLALAAGLLALTQATHAGSIANRNLRAPAHIPVLPRGGGSGGSGCYSSTPAATPRPTPTGIPSGPDPNENCYRPGPFDPNIDIDALCQCDYYDPEMATPGGVNCWRTCNAYRPEQTRIVPDNDKLSSCIRACTGSFEKARRAVEAGVDISGRDDEYWFCHGVNFIEGELCQFVGSIGGYTYSPWGASCWLVPGIGTG